MEINASKWYVEGMKIESTKNINVTLLFASPFNHLLITQRDLLSLYNTGDPKKDEHTFVEAPGLKILIFPNRQKEIIFEASRILINDKTGGDLASSEVVADLFRITTQNFIEQNKQIAYGFNFDVLTAPNDDNFEIADLIGDRIASLTEIKSAGITISFDMDSISHMLEIKPIIGEVQKFLVHFNAHYNEDSLPEESTMIQRMNEQFNEFRSFILGI